MHISCWSSGVCSSDLKLVEILDPIVEPRHALRETALRSQATPATRRGVFEFVESLPRLAAGLRVFVTQLLEDNPFQRTPRWRGLYFGGGGTEAAPGGAFIADLFTRFLPGDQPLATPSVKGNAGPIGSAHVCTPVTNAHLVCRL